jgi:hypothetical protein
VPPEVESAWLHHRFAQIHPFADGNGRVARALASLVFIRAEWFPVVVRRDERARYIEALEKADAGDLRPLVVMFVEAQRNALIQATEVACEIKPPTTADEAIAAVRDRLMQRGRLTPKQWLNAKETAGQLVGFAQQRFSQLIGHLTEEIGTPGFVFSVASGPREAEGAVQKAGLVADLTEFNWSSRLSLNTGRGEMLQLSFYAVGPRFRGIIGVVPHLSMQGTEPVLVDVGTFLINYEEDLASAQQRFSVWLEKVIVAGLNQWRLSL